MREGDFYGAKETLLASDGKSYVQYTGNGEVLILIEGHKHLPAAIEKLIQTAHITTPLLCQFTSLKPKCK